ncbi:uncharacterized protein LOC112049585 isoform X2 [Bicyclus anynana]|uniref:Uncharacterized protein LOC112049585 isoform X2 n=1 Tax=Bicyclus anynana TaxID=110368 RepID=A0ABM3M1G0_BICAN|nr:uncharacterized protein LOC112049585 isoform X2 [Bicyclus anynana]
MLVKEFNMFPCLLLFFILGSINADEAPLKCDFNRKNCSWWTDESAGGKWVYHDDKGILAFFHFNKAGEANLISPIYDHGLVEDGCFTLEYGFFIELNAILATVRVYQVPVSLGVTKLLTSTEEIKRKYIIHELESVNVINDTNLNPVSMFHPHYAEKFQIVIAYKQLDIVHFLISKFEILRGQKCIEAANAAVTILPAHAGDKSYQCRPVHINASTCCLMCLFYTNILC